jgi:RNA-directed DNA polymerase
MIMKRKSGLFKLVCDKDNIRTAIMSAMKGKSHYSEVQRIAKDVDKYVDELHEMLVNKRFMNSKYTVFTKQSGAKLREIYKLPFYPDRVVHHCIVQVLKPMWVNLLIRDTFSTIPGRGIHDGVRRVKRILKDVEGTQYCLKLDVRKYYPSVDHEALKNILKRKIKDNDLMQLFDVIIDSADGIPIGNYVSQWFGNIYLSYFDHYCKEVLKCNYYFRYCDDVVILDSNKEQLHGILVAINHYLNAELNLSVKGNFQVFPVDIRGIDFLGYRFFHTHTLVRKRIVKEMKRHLRKPKSLASYWGWLKHADTYRLTNKYFKDDWKLKHLPSCCSDAARRPVPGTVECAAQ